MNQGRVCRKKNVSANPRLLGFVRGEEKKQQTQQKRPWKLALETGPKEVWYGIEQSRYLKFPTVAGSDLPPPAAYLRKATDRDLPLKKGTAYMYLSVAMFVVESFIQPFPGESAVIPVGRHPSRIKLASTLQTFFPPPPSKKPKFNSSGTTPPDTQTTHRRQSCSRR